MAGECSLLLHSGHSEFRVPDRGSANPTPLGGGVIQSESKQKLIELDKPDVSAYKSMGTYLKRDHTHAKDIRRAP